MVQWFCGRVRQQCKSRWACKSCKPGRGLCISEAPSLRRKNKQANKNKSRGWDWSCRYSTTKHSGKRTSSVCIAVCTHALDISFLNIAHPATSSLLSLTLTLFILSSHYLTFAFWEASSSFWYPGDVTWKVRAFRQVPASELWIWNIISIHSWRSVNTSSLSEIQKPLNLIPTPL